MRVALLSQNARAGDAVGRHVAEMAGYFLDRAADVRVIVGDDGGLHPALRPFAIRQTNRANGPGWAALVAADLIVVQYPQYYPLLDLLPLLADGRRRIIFDYQGVTPPVGTIANHREAALRGREMRGLVGFADAVVCHSRFTDQELIEAENLPTDRRFRTGLVVDTAAFSPGPPRIALKDRLKIGNCRTLLFVGRLAPNKRVPILVAALAELRDVEPAVHAAIVGPSGECYEAERLKCRAIAADLGVGDRLHFLGTVDEPTLLDCYRSADALVMPSIHEGFCLPVVEAMACGLPVIAARAGALPETVGAAGLTFTRDDPKDLARQVRRLFSADRATSRTNSCRIAVVTSSFGECTGGAERSLTHLAQLLHERGDCVNVFTTRVEGKRPIGMRIAVFPAEPTNSTQRNCAAAAIESGEPFAVHEYLANTVSSDAIVAAVKQGDFDAVVVGPYVNGLTHAIVRTMGDRAIVVPCLHDEPLARTSATRTLFESAGGVLYHSRSEQELAHCELGLSHPNCAIIGSCLDFAVGDAQRGRRLARTDQYLLVCGRKAREKNLDALFAWVRGANCSYRAVFIGAGDYPIPSEPWALDLGQVCETDKCDLMAGAAALVQPSVNESLSLAVLEAFAAGVPVLVNGRCPALMEHLACGGGWAVDDAASFTAAIAQLNSEGSERGQRGQEYVRRNFGDASALLAEVDTVIRETQLSLANVLRNQGIKRAQSFARAQWRREFDRVIEHVLDMPMTNRPAKVELASYDDRLTNATSLRVILHHRGGVPLAPAGPGRSELLTRIRAGDGEAIGTETVTALPQVLFGGALAVDVLLPMVSPGFYVIEAGLRRRLGDGAIGDDWHGTIAEWNVTTYRDIEHPPHELAKPKHWATAAARELQILPDGYVDVTTGRFAKWKAWVKQKLLHNFRAAYVDVLARQQSRFNRNLLDAVDELAGQRADGRLRADLAATQAQCEHLADRLDQLERLARRDAVTTGGRR